MCFPRFLHVHHLIVSLLQVPCLQPQPVIPWPDPKGVSVHTTSHGQRCCVTLVGLLSLHALDCRKPRPMAWWPLVSLGRSSLSSSSWSSSTPSKGSCSHGGTHTRVYEHAHVRAHSRHLSHTHTHTHTHTLTHTHTHTHTHRKKVQDRRRSTWASVVSSNTHRCVLCRFSSLNFSNLLPLDCTHFTSPSSSLLLLLLFRIPPSPPLLFFVCHLSLTAAAGACHGRHDPAH